jgi:cytochrome c peroxidase
MRFYQLPKTAFLLLLSAALLTMSLALTGPSEALSSSAEEESKQMSGVPDIGKHIFFDRKLSEPVGVSCASCHDPRHAFADPRPVSPGAVAGTVGTRNAPSLMYAAFIRPIITVSVVSASGEVSMAQEGGLFHDGRARDLLEQVRQPFFTKHEMNLPSQAELAKRLRTASYADALRAKAGDEVWGDDQKLNQFAFRALVEFLREPLFRPFDARIDDFLAGNEQALNAAEKRGLDVFRNAGKCADCHLLEAELWGKPLLSDFGYDNIGAPSSGVADAGLGGISKKPEEMGQFRAPTLRNIALTAPYFHNGSVATLREVMEFYNKRDVEPQRWGKTDYPGTVNREDMGDLKLTDQQISDLTALMDAFTDRTLLELQKSKAELPAAPASAPPTNEIRMLLPSLEHPQEYAE